MKVDCSRLNPFGLPELVGIVNSRATDCLGSVHETNQTNRGVIKILFIYPVTPHNVTVAVAVVAWSGREHVVSFVLDPPTLFGPNPKISRIIHTRL